MRPLILETSKNIYIEKENDDATVFVPTAEVVTLDLQALQDGKKDFWKVALDNKEHFDNAFNYIKNKIWNTSDPKKSNFDYYEFRYVSDAKVLENTDLENIFGQKITFYLPFLSFDQKPDYYAFRSFLADWLLNYFDRSAGYISLQRISAYSTGLDIIAEPLFKYAFSLLSKRGNSRKQGLLNSFLLFDFSKNISDLCSTAYIRMYHGDKTFDADTFIKSELDKYTKLYKEN